MSIDVTLSNNGPLEFQPGLPPNYSGPILPGAMALSAKTNDVQLVIQELPGEDYSIRLSVGTFFKRLTASGNILVQGLYSYFMLKNGARKEIGSLGKMHLRQDQYTFFFSDPSPCKARFEKGKEFRALDIFYSPKLLEELLPFFPELKTVLSGFPGVILQSKPCWALPSMKEITIELLKCPYDDATRQFYFDLKVRELLFQMLVNFYKRTPANILFTPWEIARIHDTRAILETYISQKPPTIKALAKRVALTEFKLKRGFRQYFNIGIFEWLLDQKMQYAKHLLLTTNKPVKEICVLVGYPLTTNFITAFRRRFGMTPGELRRK